MAFNLPKSTQEKPKVVFKSKATCPCGHEFYPYRPYQRFCCDSHRLKYSKLESKKTYYTKKEKVIKQCKECGHDYETNDDKRHYCSNACYLSYQVKRQKPKEDRYCHVCGEKFSTAHAMKVYCSKECRMVARLKGVKDEN